VGVISQDNGAYSAYNLTPSIYRLEVSFVGYETWINEAVHIALGKETKLDVRLITADITLEEVVVSARAGSIKTGNESTVSNRRITETPTISRSIQELTRHIPENNLNSFGGASHRFNNLNIDGVAANDVIGFQEPASGAAGSQANGTPGSLAKTQPIGLGAIKELSVKLTPFDVSIGNFNGANINLITKNGTNKPAYDIYLYGNNQITLGNFSDGVKLTKSKFLDFQAGGSAGGSIKADKLFYFVNAEYAASRTPLQNQPGSAGSNIALDDILKIRNHLVDNYNYDPGEFEAADIETASTKVFARLDYIISDKHKLTIRNNYVSGFTDNLEWNATFFNFGNQGFRHKSVANSTALELKSNLGYIFNNFNIGYNTVKEGRSGDGRIFPHLQIATSSSNRVFAGTYREASVFNTDFSTLQISDKLSYIDGKHTITAGFLSQYNNVDYGFLSAWNGRWEYSSVDNFLNDRPSRVRGVYNKDDNSFDFVQSNPSATIGVVESAVYLQDKYSLSNQLEVSFGLRVDHQALTEDIPISSVLQESPEFENFDNRLRNNFQLNPRLNITYTTAEENLTLRGGTGFFSGKLPYLWFAYMEYISGTQYFNIDIRPQRALPIEEDLGTLQSIQPDLAEINLLDPNFKYPRDWKTNIGLDWKINKEWNFSTDASYTKVVQGLFFQTLNRRENLSVFEGADNRRFYNPAPGESKVNDSFTNIFVLSNTSQGYRYNISANLTREVKNMYSYLAYSYGVSKDISSTVRSSPAANYEWNQALFGNDPELSYSNYDLRHKLIAVQSFVHHFSERAEVLVSLLYNGRSGSPYSFVTQGDLNRDGSSRNDLIYIPRDRTEINLIDIVDENGTVLSSTEEQWENLDSYIKSIDYLKDNRGEYAQRNAAKTPWNHQLDMKLQYKRTTLGGKSVTLSMDVFNVLNLLHKNWGRLVFVPNVVNSSISLLKFEGVTDTYTPEYSFNLSPDEKPWLTDNFNSRWRIQLGAKLDF